MKCSKINLNYLFAWKACLICRQCLIRIPTCSWLDDVQVAAAAVAPQTGVAETVVIAVAVVVVAVVVVVDWQ